MSVTQKDIARMAGVDQSTVSRILRQDPRAKEISEKVRENVLRIASELKYQPNVSAATMRNKFNKSTVALICSEKEVSAASSYHIFLFKLIRLLNELSYGVRIYSSGDYEAIFREIRSNQIYYVICTQNTEKNFLELGKLCLRYKVKAIFNSVKQYFPEIPVFADDDTANIQMMIRHLYEKGHRKIGFAAGLPVANTTRQRIKIFRSVMASLDLPCPDEVIYQEAFSVDSFRQYLKRWQGTALCCIDNGMAGLAENALLYASFRIPQEISLISYGCPGLQDPGHYPKMSHIKTGSEKNFPAIRDYLFTEGSEKNAGAYTRFLPGILVEGDTVTAPCRENLAQKFNSL